MTSDEGRDAPANVLEEFRTRPWHSNVRCEWINQQLILWADNDFDDKGKALMDEYWDVVIACVTTDQELTFNIQAAIQLAD